ncbi:MAG: HEPN domain-containing protein [Prevotellaceae bacterium]|jgi:HEPN domain-containing protein|nr:HEPN domain-containing protein [Prevotellaceae bacterium]
MNSENVKEWLQLANDDLYSAEILNEAARKPCEIICYHCAQATEKYLKAYLTFRNIIPKKTHDLVFLYNLCIEEDKGFQSIKTICEFLNRFANDIRYPHKYEVNENDVNFSINAVEKIKELKPIVEIQNEINKNNQQ